MNENNTLKKIDPELRPTFDEIVSILREEFKKTGNPLPKAKIKNRMSSDTKRHFEKARSNGIAIDQFYVTTRGLMLSEYKGAMDIEDRLHHLKWCLGLHKAVAGQFKGDMTLKHMVDAHLHLCLDTQEKSDTYGLRLLELQKYRFGPGGKTFVLDMRERGLQEFNGRGIVVE